MRDGGVPERSNGAVLKTVGRASVPWVRIPAPPLMGFKTGMHRWISPLLRRFGVEVVPSARLYEWQKGPPTGSSHNAAELPAGAEQYLRLDNPRLAELRTRYAASPAEVTASPLWKDDYVTPEQIRFFRGDNPYVWQ